MDTETVTKLRHIMYDATDRVADATAQPCDEYLWAQFDGIVIALESFDVVPVREGGQAFLHAGVPVGYEIRTPDGSVRYFTRYGEERFALEHTDPYDRGFLTNVHDADKCAGEFCTIHHRSDHHMRSFPQHWRSDTGVMERTCPHGVGHPDPDLPYYADAWQWVHGCCHMGCCSAPRPTELTDVSELTRGDTIIDGDQGTLLIDHILIDGRGLNMLICLDETGASRFVTGSPDAKFERVA